MATNKNFEVKNGLSVGGTERISSAGAFSGSLASGVTASTQSATDNSTKIATTAYTDAAITAVIGGAPGTLDTLNELAAAINDDASYASTLTTALATKLPLAGGTMTGNLAINNGSPELHFGTTGNHYNWRLAAQETINAGFEIGVGSQDTDYSNDTYVPKLVILSGGNVGIGTSTPQGNLSVTGSSAAVGDQGIFQVTDGTGANTDTKIVMGVVASDYGWIQAVKPGTNVFDLALQPNGGNVGIGTASPMSSLHVNKDIAGNNTDGITIGKVEANGWIDSGEEMGRLSWAASYGSSFTQGIGAYISAKADANWNGNEAPTRLGFFTAPENSLTPVERLTITKDGNVKIGNIGGSGILNVNNGANDGGYVHFANNVGSTTLTNDRGLAFGWNKSNGGGESIIIGNQGSGNAGGLVFATNTSGGSYAERMRIDSSGNVSIGGTPSSAGSGSRWLSLDTPGTNTYTGGILYKINGTTKGYHYVENDYMMHQTVAGGGQKFYANAAVAMTLDSSGRLGINRVPSVGSSKLEIGGADNVRLIVVEASGHTGGIGIKGGTGSDKGLKLFSGGQIKIQLSDQTNVSYTSDGLFNANSRPSKYLSTGSGQMLLGYQDNGSGLYSGAMGLEYDCVDGLGNTSYVGGFMMKDTASGTIHLRINTNGNIYNTNNIYTSISDSRIKSDIIDASSQWDDIKALRVRKYKLAHQPAPYNDQLQIGVIAQELESAGMNGLIDEIDPDEAQLNYAPELVGEKVKIVKYSILYMKAIKALQEAMTRIEQLETRVTELEG